MNQEEAGVVVIILSRKSIITRDKQGHYIMIKKSKHKENIINIYLPNKRVSNYMKKKLIELRNRKIYN